MTFLNQMLRDDSISTGLVSELLHLQDSGILTLQRGEVDQANGCMMSYMSLMIRIHHMNHMPHVVYVYNYTHSFSKKCLYTYIYIYIYCSIYLHLYTS